MSTTIASTSTRTHGRYVLHHPEKTLIHVYLAHAMGEDGNPIPGRKPVGHLSWFRGVPTEAERQSRSNVTPGTIHSAMVRPAHRRKGLATAMLEFARDLFPASDIRHSGALSPDGKAWAEKAQ